jgi:peptide/nickel transport system permease protein
MTHRASVVGLSALVVVVAAALLAPVLAPNAPGDQFADRAFAPPMVVHVSDYGRPRAPFVYEQTLDDRLTRQFHDDRDHAIALAWFAHRRLVTSPDPRQPLLLLGADALGRDVFSRLLYGARLSLGVSFFGALVALVVGAFVGAFAGALAGPADTALMLVADFVLVLPGVYLVLVLRAALPQTMSTPAVFWLMVGLFGAVGWPHVARGVRAVVATERTRDYAEAARAAGAGPFHLARRLLPAARGFLAVELVLLVPALLVAEATVSFLGLGFPEPTPSWGTMLQEAANVSGLLSAPWTLAPAAALFVVVLCIQLAGGARATGNMLLNSGGTRAHGGAS